MKRHRWWLAAIGIAALGIAGFVLLSPRPMPAVSPATTSVAEPPALAAPAQRPTPAAAPPAPAGNAMPTPDQLRDPAWIANDAARAAAARSPIQSVDAFADLERAADAGDAAAMRRLSRFGSACESLLRTPATAAPATWPSGKPMTALESTLINNEQQRQRDTCGEIGATRVRAAANRMLDAALAGDDEALRSIHLHRPRPSEDDPRAIENWQEALVPLLEARGDDPDALYALAEVYRQGLAGGRDTQRAMDLLRRVVATAPPGSRTHRRAEQRLDALERAPPTP